MGVRCSYVGVVGGSPLLPGLHLAAFPGMLPFYAYLFRVRGAGVA